MPTELVRTIAQLVDARLRCMATGNEWAGEHTERLEQIVKECFPSGSGFDNGTRLDLDRSNCDRLIFHTAFHHMSDSGYYDGWTEHTVAVTADLAFGFRLRVSGKNRNQIKEYIHEAFNAALSQVR